jgi:GNAT superfamily N-acetyltransferase
MPSLVRWLRKIVRRQWLVSFERQLSADPAAEVAVPPDVVIRRATLDDCAALAPFIIGVPAERRLAQGQIALVAELDGQLVGCIWLSRGPVSLPRQLTVRPRPHEVYSYGLRVLPELRRRGIARALIRSYSPEVIRLGATVTFNHVDAWNRPAVAVQQALGATVREETFGVVLLDRFAITLWRRRR